MRIIDNIQDIEAYIHSMSTTMRDKCWWLDKIPEKIDTIVDYGCAQGDMAIFIESIRPGKFKYIGIDNSPEMLALASHNHYLHFGKRSEFLSDLSCIKQKCDTGKSILVLNSVVHEIFSYMTDGEIKALFSEMFSAGFAYIAIRDMYSPEEIIFEDSVDGVSDDAGAEYALDMISGSKYYGDMWTEFNAHIDSKPDWPEWGTSRRLLEFLMKYRYVGNWRREMKEVYFWDWIPKIFHACNHTMSKYKILHDEEFRIPFILDKIETDFGIRITSNTHRKVMFGA